MDVDLVVVDLTGTTVEDRGEIEHSFQEALAAHGLELDREKLASVRGKSKREALAELLPRGDAPLDAVHRAFVESLARRYESEAPRLVPGALETVAFLKSRGVAVAVNTGLDRPVAGLVLRALDPEGLLGPLVCGDDVVQGRPAPYLLFRAMERTGAASVHRVMAVGDTARDLEAGFHAGVGYNVGVLTGAHGAPELEKAPHSHILPSIAHIPLLWG